MPSPTNQQPSATPAEPEDLDLAPPSSGTVPSAAPDISTWPTRQEVADLLHWSLATVDRYISRSKFTTAKRPRPGKKPEIVVSPADVAAYREEPPAHPAMPTTNSSSALALSSPPPSPQQQSPSSPELFALVATIARAISPPPEPAKFLTLQEAAEVTGLTETYLRRAITSGQLRAIRDGKTQKIRKGDLAGL